MKEIMQELTNQGNKRTATGRERERDTARKVKERMTLHSGFILG